jgi:hypothetical protein
LNALARAESPISTVWEVLSKNAREFVQIMQAASLAGLRLAKTPDGFVGDDEVEFSIIWRHLQLICRDAGLTTSARVLDTIPIATAQEAATAFAAFNVTFHAELDARQIYFLTSPWTYLFEQRGNPFGAQVDEAFPSIRRELKEAGKCMALERHTAAVMHLMRSTETPLKLLCDAVGVTFSHAAGEKLLNDVRGQLKAVASGETKPAGWKADEKFYSDAEAHLRAFKDAWRNYAMHLHDTYNEEEASAIWHSVKAFMTGVAGRLHE